MEINSRGNKVLRDADADREMSGVGDSRDTYDFRLCTTESGWRQFDTEQDAWYFGVSMGRHHQPL
jgi:hypothetical protein